MSRLLFTGERLHEGDALFAVDLARHRAAYEFARTRAGAGPVLDLGCGTGYGTALLTGGDALVLGIDRIAPDAANRSGGARFLRAEAGRLPLASRSVALVVSFQVIEHLEDPAPYLESIGRLLGEGGQAILTTPNVRLSDGVNPYHVHEYEAEELASCLRGHFAEVELLGVGMSDAVRSHMEARSRRIRRIMHLDPFRLRDRLPAALVERLFAAFAVWVRRRGRTNDGPLDVTTRDFPIGHETDGCLDLMAVCRRPL